VLWKTYFFGRLADRQFLSLLSRNRQPLKSFVAVAGEGYEPGSKKSFGKELGQEKALGKIASRYDDDLVFDAPPDSVYRTGQLKAYKGFRILVTDGIQEKDDPKGQIFARLAEDPFSFSSSIHGIRLSLQEKWIHKLLLGIMWSSLARYYFFMTTSNWGLWKHKILIKELLQLPVVLEKLNPATKKVISSVDKLLDYRPQEQDVTNQDGVSKKTIRANRRKLETQLDKAIFELYELNEEQKDLIRDCCEVTLPFFYKPLGSIGAMPAVDRGDLSWIEDYVRVFCRRWNVYLDEGEEMRAEVHVGAHDNMVAIDFYPASKKEPWNLKPTENSWEYILERIGESLPRPMGTSRILHDGLVHVISEEGIIVIKRNEKRLWTKSLAREDADTTLCKRIVDTSQKSESNK
jgi:hypothetical protein